MDDSLIGKTGSPFTMVVEKGKIREFARATKSTNPAYVEENPPLAPATFLAAAAFWQGPGASPWSGVERNFERILHGEQEFVYPNGPPRAGAVLNAQSRIDKVYEKEGRRGGTMTFTEMVTEFRDEAGELVAESRSVTIETSKPATEG